MTNYRNWRESIQTRLVLNMEKWAEQVPPADDLSSLPSQIKVSTAAEYVAFLVDVRGSFSKAACFHDEEAPARYKSASKISKVDGISISIENPAGSTRTGKNKDGDTWSRKMAHHYGYVVGTEGYDGDEVDVFVNPEQPITGKVFVIYQVDPNSGDFDEHKCMIGFESEDAAKGAYLENFPSDWKGFGKIEELSWKGFKDWVKSDKPVNSTFDRSRSSRQVKKAFTDLRPVILSEFIKMAEVSSVDGTGGNLIDLGSAQDKDKVLPRMSPSYSSLRKEPKNRNGRKWLYSFCERNPGSPLCRSIRSKRYEKI